MPPLPAALGYALSAAGGLCLGWVLTQGAGRPAPEGELPASPTAAVAASGSPSLEGVARAAPGGGRVGAAQGVAPTRPRVAVAEPSEVLPVFTFGGRELPEGRGSQVLHALAMLHAALGHVAEFEALVPRCLAAGVDPAEALGLVELLPSEQRLACLERLLAGPYAGLKVDAVQHARLLSGAGAKERAIALLSERLGDGLEQNVARALIELDPAGASRLLLEHEGLAEADTDLLQGLGVALLQAGQPALLWPFVERVLAQGAFPAQVLEHLAGSDPALGLEIMDRLMAERREDPSVWHWLGRLREANANAAGAFEAYQQAAQRGVLAAALQGMLRVDPQRAHAVAKTLDLSGLVGEDRAIVAVLALHAGAASDAFDALARGLEQSPSEYSLLNAIARADPVRAAALLRERASAYQGEDRDELLGACANALRLAGRHEEARQAYLEALALDSTDGEWIGGLLRLDPERALQALEAARADSQGDTWWQLARASAMFRTGRRAEALALYNLHEGDADAAASLGLLDPPEGRRRLESILAREPRNASAWVALGEMERELGNLPAARSALEQAVRLEPHNLFNVVRWRQVQPPLEGAGPSTSSR